MKWITRSHVGWKQLPAATVCASRMIWKTCNTNLKSMTRCTHGGVTLADGPGLQPGNITVTEQGLVIGFVIKQR